jgi:phosphatidylserine/phosphatidylglycerophosphate/cardiolipin synthase-like enzyme
MRTLVVAICALLLVANVTDAKCTGSPNCRACTNCARCGHCKAGGTCGVCAPASPDTKTTPEPSQLSAFDRRMETFKAERERREAKERREADDQRAAGEAKKAKSTETAADATTQPVTVYFAPDKSQACTNAIAQQIDSAKTSVKVQALRLTSLPIVKALAAAHKRGVKVTIVLDGAQQSTKYSDATYFSNAGMSPLIDKSHKTAHNKVIIIDEAILITGSFNFSANAEQNAENVLVIRDMPKVVEAYAKNFALHEEHAKPYVPPSSAAKPKAPAKGTRAEPVTVTD